MSHITSRSLFPLICLFILTGITLAQAPTGSVRGTITDQNSAVAPNARITVTHKATGAAREAVTNSDGQFQVTSLQPGEYEIKISAPGFKTGLGVATVQTGENVTVDFTLEVGATSETVVISGDASSIINTTDYKIDGVVNRQQIENLPLNGRNFLQLSSLEPGVAVGAVTSTGALPNNFFRVSIAGAGQHLTRISVDGATINDKITGGTSQNFSQESVQEFQISTFNFDLTTTVTGAGSVNVVSRSGGNQLHGSAFFYFRDHNLAAYPDLGRDPLRFVDPARDDPFFARRQSGGSLSGPLKKDRLFWFFNFEHNNQDGVFAVNNNHAIFSQFDTVHPNPLTANQGNLRLDWKATDKHSVFLRLSNDHSNLITPQAAAGATMPSNWFKTRNKAAQGLIGATSVLTPKFVNDFRYSYSYYAARINAPGAEDCDNPIACIGLGGPLVNTNLGGIQFGNHNNVPQGRILRTYQMTDTVNWQLGAHRVRTGFEWEHFYEDAFWAFADPAQITLWDPLLVRTRSPQLYAALPDSLKVNAAGTGPLVPGRLPTVDEILQLPLHSFQFGVGDAGQPPAFRFDDASRNDRLRFFIGDAWQMKPGFTLSYGLAYVFETRLLNHDLDRPQLLSALLGGDLSAPRRDRNNFDPTFGFAWNLGGKGKTVLRGGAGLYHDAGLTFVNYQERGLVGPSGNGRYRLNGSIVPAPAGQPGPVLNYVTAPTAFKGAQLIPLLPQIRAEQTARFGDGQDLSVRGIEIIKQANAQIFDPNTVTGYSINTTIGAQRELARGLVAQADFVMRRSVHFGSLNSFGDFYDRNRFNRAASLGGPVIPVCAAAQRNDPKAICSTGPITISASDQNYRYTGLHVKVDKRFSERYQFTASYALSRFTGFNTIVNFDNYHEADGFQPNDRRHRLTFSGTMELPKYGGGARFLRGLFNTWRVGLIAQYNSSLPLNTIISALDLDGDGNAVSLLPGTNWNSLGRQVSASELRDLVAKYNADVEARSTTMPNGAIIRPTTPRGQPINPITLPAEFSNGDDFLTHDLRVSRFITLRENVRLQLLGEVFNLFNISNLGGYSGVLNSGRYGQPSDRVGQVFGSGGPRAFQLAARFNF